MNFNTTPKPSDLNKFFLNNPNGKKHFRYFNNRPYEIIKNHKITLLLVSDDNIIGYGHLDVEDGITWLGIMVSDSSVGMGYGKKIMEELLKYHDGPIQLSVDYDNEFAIKLYKSFNFNVIDNINNKVLIMKKNENSLP